MNISATVLKALTNLEVKAYQADELNRVLTEVLQDQLRSRLRPKLQAYDKPGYLIMLHAFTDGHNECFDIGDVDEAVDLFIYWCLEYGRARVYFDCSEVEGDTVHEDCLLSFGDYPD